MEKDKIIFKDAVSPIEIEV